MIPELHLDGNRLLAVPACHYRAVFAEAVHRTCLERSTRPQAVAVELGQGAVDAVVTWMRELGVGGLVPSPLPCMLGLAGANRLIHPKHRVTMLRLQEVYARPLHELPAGLLKEHFDFSAVSVLALSPTDSIIEAIRSAVELNLPVYGVDLGECAHVNWISPMIDDPSDAGEDLAGWVERNSASVADGRDPWVDDRREEAMAAWLRLLLRQYGTVLFTGGVGHWSSLVTRLRDPAGRPAIALPKSSGKTLRRVLIDPALAIRQMDLFPDFTMRYESRRNLDPSDPERRRGCAGVLRKKFAEAIECAEPAERERVRQFIAYVGRVALVNLRAIPDLASMLNAAQAMVSPDYARRLGEALVHRALPWASAADWKDLPCLRPVPPTPEERALPGSGQKAELVSGGVRSGSFFVENTVPADLPSMQMILPPLENDERLQIKNSGCFGSTWVWPPCEHQFFGSAYAAAGQANEEADARPAEPFAGSLHNGVDPKATLRAYARGDTRVQVRPVRRRSRVTQREALTEPVVYLFSGRDEVINGRWRILTAGGYHHPYVRDKHRYQEVLRQKGDIFVSSVQLSEARETEMHLRPWVEETRYLWGAVSFGNPCVNIHQSTRWLEEGNYNCGPILRQSGMAELTRYYREQHTLGLEEGDWHSTLIRIGIPYAKQRVVVVATDRFRLSAEVRREAAARRIEVTVMPLSSIPVERINSIRRQYYVRTKDAHGLEFPPEAAAALGQAQNANREELPDFIRAQLT